MYVCTHTLKIDEYFSCIYVKCIYIHIHHNLCNIYKCIYKMYTFPSKNVYMGQRYKPLPIVNKFFSKTSSKNSTVR